MAHHRFDDITVEDLVTQASMKWTRNPGKLAAFVAEMDFGIAPVITQALHDEIDAGRLGYLPPDAIRKLTQATSAFLSDRFGWEVPRARIYPVADVLAAYEGFLERFTRPGSPIIIPTPAYMPFFTITALRNRDVIQVPMVPGVDGRLEMDLEAIGKAFAAGAHGLILCNPHNPVGRVYSKEELLALSEVVEKHGGRVFSDEIHAPITFEDYRHLPYASLTDTTAGHTITAVSASKAWNIPGVKCAQLIVSNDEDQAALQEFGPMVSHGAGTPGLVANAVAYEEGAEWLDDVLAYIAINRDRLAELIEEHLPGVRYTPPEGTYIAWLDCRGLPDVTGDVSWSEFFAEHAGVALTDGALCGEAGVGHVRMMLAAPTHILELIVSRMGDAVKKAQSA